MTAVWRDTNPYDEGEGENAARGLVIGLAAGLVAWLVIAAVVFLVGWVIL